MATTARISLCRPTDDALERFLEEVRHAPFSYSERGASNDGAPTGYDLDHNCVRLGTGRAIFERARDALARWAMFPSGWSRVFAGSSPPIEGQTVGVQFRLFGLWWLNATRIVYVIDDEIGGEIDSELPQRRFGFAYGTLTCHVERGEERFLVEWRSDDSVWYELRAFSRPSFWAARAAKPVARLLQRRFVRDSQAAMKAAVEAAPH